MPAAEPAHVAAFFDLVAPIVGEGRAEPGTLMGGPCLRADGEFVAMPLSRTTKMGAAGGLVVKLPRDRVDELVAAGRAAPFGPAGKVFKEWAQVTSDDQEEWLTLIEEAIAFSGT